MKATCDVRQFTMDLPPRTVLLLLAPLLAASCSSDDPNPSTTTPAAASPESSPTATVDATCEISPNPDPDNALQGETNEGELWALPAGPWEPRVNEDFRVTLRVTGQGDFAVSAVGPDGSERRPAIGPVRQFGTSSGLERPGDEWAMVFSFDQAGCWHLEVTRGELEGAVYFEVDD